MGEMGSLEGSYSLFPNMFLDIFYLKRSIGKMCVLFYIATLMQTAISALQSVLQEDFKATAISALQSVLLYQTQYSLIIEQKRC